MATGGIFLKTTDSLVVLQPSDYDSEAVLQTALEKFPAVIAGATTSGDSEPQLLLITREMGVPGSDTGGGTFSLDHLFVDSDCVPVFVEVKRSSDTRIRREVVGQMLDYAANGVKYWPIETLKSALEKQAAKESRVVAELISGLDPDLEVAEFWVRVEANLKAGKVRLLFVADSLPRELVRIIEFLNEQMSPAEVLGVELQQFVKDEHIAYVPHVVGQTTAAAAVKSPGSGQLWTKQSFLDAASARVSESEMKLIQRLITDVEERGVKLNWGKGVTPGVAGWYQVGDRPTGVWTLNANTESPTTKAYLQFYFADFQARTSHEVVEKVATELEKIPALKPKVAEARANQWKKYPSVYLVDIAGYGDQEHALLEAITRLLEPSEPSGGGQQGAPQPPTS